MINLKQLWDLNQQPQGSKYHDLPTKPHKLIYNYIETLKHIASRHFVVQIEAHFTLNDFQIHWFYDNQQFIVEIYTNKLNKEYSEKIGNNSFI